jgi:hypothetical protein
MDAPDVAAEGIELFGFACGDVAVAWSACAQELASSIASLKSSGSGSSARSSWKDMLCSGT